MGRPRKILTDLEEANAEVAANIDFDNTDYVQPIEDGDGIAGAILTEPEAKKELVRLQIPPKMDDPAWTNWVLSQFEENELEEGLPKVDGLRRLTRKLIGPILKGKANIKQCPTIENEQRATVEYTIVVLNKYQLEDDDEPYEIEFTDVADAYPGNVRGIEYVRFPSAMASTRGEVRALRKILGLFVIALEETSDQPLEEAGFSGKITESQITKIDIKCRQMNINVMKFINMGKKKYKDIVDIPNAIAVKMFAEINLYQQYDEKNPKSVGKPIPAEIKHYDANWRKDES